MVNGSRESAPILGPHLVELVDADHPPVRQHHRPPLQVKLPGAVLDDGRCQTRCGRALSGRVHADGGGLLHELEELRGRGKEWALWSVEGMETGSFLTRTPLRVRFESAKCLRLVTQGSNMLQELISATGERPAFAALSHRPIRTHPSRNIGFQNRSHSQAWEQCKVEDRAISQGVPSLLGKRIRALVRGREGNKHVKLLKPSGLT
jgi:hypothetical protein